MTSVETGSPDRAMPEVEMETRTGADSFRCGHVAIVGRTNAGKSTLVNRLVGEKISIVSPTAQTTRNLVIGIRNTPGAQVVLVDTPGFHLPQHELNRRMIDEAQGSMQGVDAIVLVIDASDRVGKGDQFALERVKATGTPFVLAFNKVDRVRPTSKLLPTLTRFAEAGAAALVPISGATGDNVETLIAQVVALLPEAPPIYPVDITTDQTERFLVAELIREKILLATRQEVPHAAVVLIDRMAEKKGKDGKPLLVVAATIAVEKDNQKAILIGRQGSMLKHVGSEARKDVESELGIHAHLALTVIVHPRWREDASVLERIYAGTRAIITGVDETDSDDGADDGDETAEDDE
jgi:GTP-binding protein Era